MSLRLGVAAILLAFVVAAAPALAQPELKPGQCEGQPGFILDDGNPATADPCFPDPSGGGGALPQPSISVSAPSDPVIKETDSGGKSFTFTKAQGTAADSAVTVRYRLSGTATNASKDYMLPAGYDKTANVGTFTMQPSDTTKTVLIKPERDTEHPEPVAPGALNNETVDVTILDGEGYTHEAAMSKATMNIQSIEPNAVAIAALDAQALEGQETAPGNGSFRITRTGPLQSELTVALTPGGDTSSLKDPLPTSATFAGGAAAVVIKVVYDQDTTIGDKQVTLALTSNPTPRAYTITGLGEAAVTLADDDTPRVSIAVADATLGEVPAATGTFQVSRTGPTTSALTVGVSFGGTAKASGGTASDPQDFDVTGAPSNVVTIPANQASATVTIVPRADAVREGTETVNMTLVASTATPPGYLLPTVVAQRTATLDLIDDDVPAVNVTATDRVATEAGSTTAVFLLKRGAQDLASSLTIGFQVTGTARAADYLLPGNSTITFSNGNGTVTFAANQATALVTVTAVDDTASEGNETLRLTLKQATTTRDYTVGSPGFAEVTITDNDLLDQDGDNVDDAVDNCLGLNAADQTDTDADKKGNPCDTDDDNDGLSDAQETTLKTNPLAEDTDRDGRADKSEVDAKTDPLDLLSPSFAAGDVTFQATGSGVRVTWSSPAGSLATRFLVFRASDPVLVGTVLAQPGASTYTYDDTTFPGNGSHRYYVQPMLPSQSGSAYDAAQASGSSEKTIALCEAFKQDTDGDGLCDKDELARGTDARDADSDADGVTDFAEVQAGTDPLEPSTVGPGEVKLSKEIPFWVGLGLAVVALVLLVVALVRARKPAPEPEPAQHA